jgi:hypothetical protein
LIAALPVAENSDVGPVLKGTGFSPYVKPQRMSRALAPEEDLLLGKLTFSATSLAAEGSTSQLEILRCLGDRADVMAQSLKIA